MTLPNTEVALAAGLITFSGIAATLAVQLTSKRARTEGEVIQMVTLSICAFLFVLATIFALLYLLGLWCPAALTWSSRLALMAMLVLLGFLVSFVPAGLRRSWRIVRQGGQEGERIDQEAHTHP